MFIEYEKITPEEYKNRFQGNNIYYEFYNSPFGKFLLAVTRECICNLYFVSQYNENHSVSELKKFWPLSSIVKSRQNTEKYGNEIENYLESMQNLESRFFLKGTPFQVKVWEALLQIPEGSTVSYRDVSVFIGMPKSSRAVANAIGKNPVAFIIPCHRVVRSTGHPGGYRWGLELKKKLIEREIVIT
ncbi:MAG: methylated-DNA--[protein]-cysteine S-methyltransferase [Chitinispirillia bacterium]|jgi:AraC family transcriptional regulator of adaptative response/methylated-DNA-[protein]-cysteine methyltransferase